MRLNRDAKCFFPVENRVFKPGDKVLVFLPIPGHPLQARYFGPYEIESKISDVNYVVKTPGRRKEKRVCHVNMLKEYFDSSDRNFVPEVSDETGALLVYSSFITYKSFSHRPT